jgi:flagellar basal-body rod protein FlgC
MLESSFSPIDVSSSGLSAERIRMDVIANNIANASTTRTPDGGPYRRQQVVFSAVLGREMAAGASSSQRFGGVTVVGVEPDGSAMPRVYQPSHPHADADGFVAMPNVSLPNEMVDLVTASRAYEANLRAIRLFRQMAQQTISLLRGGGG